MSPLETKLHALKAADIARKEQWKRDLVIPDVSLIKNISNELLVFELLEWTEKAKHPPEGVFHSEEYHEWIVKAQQYKAAVFEEMINRMKK